MKKMRAVTSTSLKSNFQSASLVVVYLGIVLICALAIGVIGDKSIIGPAVESGEIDADTISYYIGIIGYSAAVIVTGSTYCVLFSVPLAREKVSGNIEALLATSISVKELFIAKSFALFLPGFLVGTIIPFAMTALISSRYFSSGFEAFTNPWVVVCTFVAVPIVYFCESLLIHIVGLTGSTEGGNVLCIIFTNAFSIIVINLLSRQVFDARKWPFFAANLGLAGIMLILCIILCYRIRKERIVLSCLK